MPVGRGKVWGCETAWGTGFRILRRVPGQLRLGLGSLGAQLEGTQRPTAGAKGTKGTELLRIICSELVTQVMQRCKSILLPSTAYFCVTTGERERVREREREGEGEGEGQSHYAAPLHDALMMTTGRDPKASPLSHPPCSRKVHPPSPADRHICVHHGPDEWRMSPPLKAPAPPASHLRTPRTK